MAAIKPATDLQTETSPTTRQMPLYHVVLIDDNEHTYDYVIEMLCGIIRCSVERAYQLACVVDREGRVIVETCSLEKAELRREQIHSFGADWRIECCKGSMTAEIERA